MPTSRRALATAMTILPVLAVPAVYLLAAFTGPRLSDREFFIALALMPWGVLPGYGLAGRMGRGQRWPWASRLARRSPPACWPWSRST
jgi:hypothetical protein